MSFNTCCACTYMYCRPRIVGSHVGDAGPLITCTPEDQEVKADNPQLILSRSDD